MESGRLQEVFLFFVSGSIGNALFFLLYDILFRVIWWDSYKSTICWLVSYMATVAIQMELHSRIVWKTPIMDYKSTILKGYMVYSLSIVLSTVINTTLVMFCYYLRLRLIIFKSIIKKLGCKRWE